jgi:hypothetical protein
VPAARWAAEAEKLQRIEEETNEKWVAQGVGHAALCACILDTTFENFEKSTEPAD